jgi:hypothetical protein
MNTSRRRLFQFAATALLATSLSTAWAAKPVVEIVAFGHPPVQAALKPLREWLATQGKKFSVVEIDMETPAGEKRAAEVGITGHVPILILVNGKYTFSRKDASTVELKSFPSAAVTKGAWTIEDAKTAILATH